MAELLAVPWVATGYRVRVLSEVFRFGAMRHERCRRVGAQTEEHDVPEVGVVGEARNDVQALGHEVMAGLNLKEVGWVMGLVQEVNRRGVTILMIERVMKAYLGRRYAKGSGVGA